MPESMNEMGDFVGRVLKKGTIADKLAAHTLLVHESLNFASLNSLIDMVDPRKCRRECVMAMDTLKELFLDSLSSQNPSLRIRCDELGIHYDDVVAKLKYNYTKFIDRLELVAFDTIDNTRNKALSTMSDLLIRHPDNKKYILEKLINKIGDKTPKIATRASYLVEKIINEKKPELKTLAIEQIERFLKRPGVTDKAQYYVLCLLNHIMLARNDQLNANKLLNIYLGFFSTLVKSGNVDSKLMGSILTGINRVYPYSRLEGQIFEQQLQVLYTIVHYVNLNMSIQALVLIHTILCRRLSTQQIPIEDRYYNAVYSQLLHDELPHCARQKSFLTLLCTLVSQDKVSERRRAFIKRLAQVAIGSQPNFACAIMITINRILMATRETIDVNSGDKHKSDTHHQPSNKQVVDSVKDESQAHGEQEKSMKKKNQSRKEMLAAKLAKFQELDDEDEDDDQDACNDIKGEKQNHIDDDQTIRESETPAKKSKSDEQLKKKNKKQSDASTSEQFVNGNSGPIDLSKIELPATKSWVHRSTKGDDECVLKEYDPMARNPRFCKAEKSALWELVLLRRHFHPSVTIFVQQAMERNFTEYTGDPLEDFSSKHFLDKYAKKGHVEGKKKTSGGDGGGNDKKRTKRPRKG